MNKAGQEPPGSLRLTFGLTLFCLVIIQVGIKIGDRRQILKEIRKNQPQLTRHSALDFLDLPRPDIKMTLRYAHLSQARLKEAVAVLNKIGINPKVTPNPHQNEKADSHTPANLL